MRYSNKYRVSPEEVEANLDLLASAKLQDKEPSFNLIVINTPTGKMTIKTNLTAQEWIAEQELRLTNLPNKKKKRK
tara:strand:+ start:210 stop:437 length:228 start_codon:yes stop_codon:yes gene_type:complete